MQNNDQTNDSLVGTATSHFQYTAELNVCKKENIITSCNFTATCWPGMLSASAFCLKSSFCQWILKTHTFTSKQEPNLQSQMLLNLRFNMKSYCGHRENKVGKVKGINFIH